MKAWGALPQEKAMGTFAHDHANALAIIGNAVRNLRRRLEQQDVEGAKEILERITTGNTRHRECFDEYYKKFQADFPEKL